MTKDFIAPSHAASYEKEKHHQHSLYDDSYTLSSSQSSSPSCCTTETEEAEEEQEQEPIEEAFDCYISCFYWQNSLFAPTKFKIARKYQFEIAFPTKDNSISLRVMQFPCDSSLLEDIRFYLNNYNQITFTATKSWERSVVFDWLMEISVEFSLMRQTFHLALNYFDRFICSLSQRTNFALAKDEVENEKVFFIGLTCLFIASKVEEIYPPKLSKLLSYAGHFKQNEIKSAELMILQGLKWELNVPTLANWVHFLISVLFNDDGNDSNREIYLLMDIIREQDQSREIEALFESVMNLIDVLIHEFTRIPTSRLAAIGILIVLFTSNSITANGNVVGIEINQEEEFLCICNSMCEIISIASSSELLNTLSVVLSNRVTQNYLIQLSKSNHHKYNRGTNKQPSSFALIRKSRQTKNNYWHFNDSNNELNLLQTYNNCVLEWLRQEQN